MQRVVQSCAYQAAVLQPKASRRMVGRGVQSSKGNRQEGEQYPTASGTMMFSHPYYERDSRHLLGYCSEYRMPDGTIEHVYNKKQPSAKRVEKV